MQFENIYYHLTPEHGAVVVFLDEAVADEFDDFLVARDEPEVSIKFEEKKVTYFLPHQVCESSIESILKKFFQMRK